MKHYHIVSEDELNRIRRALKKEVARLHRKAQPAEAEKVAKLLNKMSTPDAVLIRQPNHICSDTKKS